MMHAYDLWSGTHYPFVLEMWCAMLSLPHHRLLDFIMDGHKFEQGLYIYICIYDALQSWDIFETPWKVKDSLSNWHLMVFFSNFRYAIYFHNQVSSQGALSQLAAVEMEVGREETERCSWLDDLEMQVMVASIHIIHIIHILFIIYIDTYISINNCALEISKMFNSITNWCSNDSSRLDLDAVETCRIFA